MKKIALILLALISIGASAQQNQEVRRNKTPFLFPEFRPAKVMQTFGRHIEVEKANIAINNGSFVYMQGDSVLTPSNNSILGVQFDTIDVYMRVDGMVMGRVLASENYNNLLCVTAVDRDLLTEETNRETAMAFLTMTESNFIDYDQFDRKEGYPLCDTYYFSIKGVVIPAIERIVKKNIAPDKKREFKKLMDDRWWSWHDAESLARLLPLFP